MHVFRVIDSKPHETPVIIQLYIAYAGAVEKLLGDPVIESFPFMDMVHAKYTKPDIAGMTPKEQLKELSTVTKELVETQYNTYNRSLLPALKKVGLHVVEKHEDLTKEQQAYVDRYFEESV